MKKQDVQKSESLYLKAIPQEAEPLASSDRLHSAVRESLRESLASEFIDLVGQEVRSEITYNELSHQPLQKKTPLELVKDNLTILEELVARWTFVMHENRYLLKLDNDDTP